MSWPMDATDPSTAMVTAGALIVAAFVAREVAAGALRAAGNDLWQWVKRTARR